LEKVVDSTSHGGLMTRFDSLPGADSEFMIALLGGFSLLWQGSVLQIPKASQRLLALLALRGGPIERAAVAGTLWPDSSERQAHSSLRSALARMGRSARSALAATKLEIRLANGVGVDVSCAQGAARRILDPATTLGHSELGMGTVRYLSADLLPNWYDDWVLIEVEDWRQLRLHALEALADRLIAAGRWGEAVGAAGAAVRAEPLRESGYAALIQVHLAEGNQSEAVREFSRYRALLHAELGLEPTPRLRQLVHGLPTTSVGSPH
jgi:SARP family transcriptional regulator, regulator of embCAB operon